MPITVELTSGLVAQIKKRQKQSYYLDPLHRDLKICHDIRHVIDIAFKDNETLPQIKESLDSGKLYSVRRHSLDPTVSSPKTSIITIDDKLYLKTDRLIELENLFDDQSGYGKNRKYRIIL